MRDAEFLSETVKLINTYGPDSAEVVQYISENAPNEEVRGLAELSRKLKKALAPNFKPLADNAFVLVSPMGQAVSWSYITIENLKRKYAGTAREEDVNYFIREAMPGDFLGLDERILFRSSN